MPLSPFVMTSGMPPTPSRRPRAQCGRFDHGERQGLEEGREGNRSAARRCSLTSSTRPVKVTRPAEVRPRHARRVSSSSTKAPGRIPTRRSSGAPGAPRARHARRHRAAPPAPCRATGGPCRRPRCRRPAARSARAAPGARPLSQAGSDRGRRRAGSARRFGLGHTGRQILVRGCAREIATKRVRIGAAGGCAAPRRAAQAVHGPPVQPVPQV